MDEVDRQEAIRQFLELIASDEDEGSDSEVYRQTGELIADFFRNIEHRFMSIEYRLGQLEGERYGHQKD